MKLGTLTAMSLAMVITKEVQVRNSAKLVHVYAELRGAIGDAMPAGEILAMAERLLDLATRREIIDRCGRIDDTSFGCVPIDSAMRDGGWALLCDQWSAELFGDDALDLSWQPASRHALPSQAEYYA